ncbi:MAG: hypothetical protein HQ475_09575 [SAR202 cluster bacterium]|nr:hypothetical protein [SAR202 cluster bacterium]
MNAPWRIWLGRAGAVGALACGIIGLIVGFDSSSTWKLGASGWFTGGSVAALLAIVMYLDDAAASRNR